MPDEASLVTDDQAALDLAFADLDHLLAEKHAAPYSRPACCNPLCRSIEFEFCGPSDGYPGARVCLRCACVQPGPVFFETQYGQVLPTRSSNYKRVHHWHERISQLLLMESEIPDTEMLEIAEKLCSGAYTVLNKDNIREVLRSVNKQSYIEKWLQIVFKITGVQPPCPGPLILRELDSLFLELQRPFEACKQQGRRNFLNYNYVFNRLFQKLNCTQFCIFFPMIKSQAKLQALDATYLKMAQSLNWPETPLKIVAPFAVRLTEPDLLLSRLRASCARRAQAVPEKAKTQTVFCTMDRRKQASVLGNARSGRSARLGRRSRVRW